MNMEDIRRTAGLYRDAEWEKYSSEYPVGLVREDFNAGFAAGVEYISTILTAMSMGFAPGSEPEDSTEADYPTLS